MYTVIPSPNGYFMLPTEAATYLKLAGTAQLKALIAVYKNMGTPLSPSDIAKQAGLSESDAEDALVFWAKKGLIAKTGELPRTVVSENKKQEEPPAAKSDNSESSALKSGEEPKKVETEIKKATDDTKKIPKIKPTLTQINSRCREDSEIRELFLQAQVIFGRTIGYDTQAQLLMCCDYLGLPVPVVLMICEYARSSGKTGVSYITKTAESWAEAGINTIEAANKKIAALEDSSRIWKEFAARVGISTPSPSKSQSEYIYKWTAEFGYGTEEICAAYDEMADHITKFSMAYMDKALTTWHEAGLKNAAEIKKYREEHKLLSSAKKPSESKSKPARAAKSGGEKTVSYDSEAAEKKAAMGAPVYERKKKK